VSLDVQAARIRQHCEATGLALQATFADAGISGRRQSNRPQLAEALSTACSARGTLVVFSLSRLARSLGDAITIVDRLAKADAHLTSLSESLDTRTASGRLVFRLFASLAEFESDLASERICASMATKRLRREVTGPAPFGFIAAGSKLIPDPSEQHTLNLIAEYRSTGCSLRTIARRLNEAGVPPKKSARWQASSVDSILRRCARNLQDTDSDASSSKLCR
jgi:DNA invertase Pin-like site-specific DNA recombinase